MFHMNEHKVWMNHFIFADEINLNHANNRWIAKWKMCVCVRAREEEDEDDTNRITNCIELRKCVFLIEWWKLADDWCWCALRSEKRAGCWQSICLISQTPSVINHDRRFGRYIQRKLQHFNCTQPSRRLCCCCRDGMNWSPSIRDTH